MVNGPSPDWLKTSALAGCGIVLWLMALSPIGKLGKGVCLIISLTTSIQLVRVTRSLIVDEAKAMAANALNQELYQREIAFAAYQYEQELETLYTESPTSATSHPEVMEAQRKSLEDLWDDDDSEFTSELSASQERSLYLAVKVLLESGKSETFVVEEVLKMGGRKYADGQARLRELLQKAKSYNW